MLDTQTGRLWYITVPGAKAGEDGVRVLQPIWYQSKDKYILTPE